METGELSSQCSPYSQFPLIDLHSMISEMKEDNSSFTPSMAELVTTNQRNLSINNNSGTMMVKIIDEDKGPATSTGYTTPEPQTNIKPCDKNAFTKKRCVQRKIDFPERKRRRLNYNINIKNNSGTVAIYGSPPAEDDPLFSDLNNCYPEESDGPNSQAISPGKPLRIVADDFVKERLNEVYEIINRLHPLRDNGKWREFHDVVTEEVQLARCAGNMHIEVLLAIEVSITFSYQKDFEGSQRKIEEAKNMLESSKDFPIKLFLLAYLHCHWTALNRRQNKATCAQRCTVIAQQNVELVPSKLIKAFADYEHASNLTKTLSLIDVDEPERLDILEESKNALRNCITSSEQVIQEEKSLYLVRHQFALVKLALMNLNCRTRVSRRKPITENCIQEAGYCIKRMEERYKDQLSQSIHIQYLNAKSDFCFRREEFENARFHAQAALETAETAGFQLEIKSIKERLQDIHALIINENRME